VGTAARRAPIARADGAPATLGVSCEMLLCTFSYDGAQGGYETEHISGYPMTLAMVWSAKRLTWSIVTRAHAPRQDYDGDGATIDLALDAAEGTAYAVAVALPPGGAVAVHLTFYYPAV
jgi:hypothetical protein